MAENTVILKNIFENYFKKSLLEDFICKNCSSLKSVTSNISFAIWFTTKENTPVMKIIFQIHMYDIESGTTKKNQNKITIPLELFMTITQRNEKIFYTLVSLIIYEDSLFYIGNYYSDILYFSTRIWWHCDEEKLPKSVIDQKVYILDNINKKLKNHICGSY